MPLLGRAPQLEEVVDLDDGARGGDDDQEVVAVAVQRDVGGIEIGEDERVGVGGRPGVVEPLVAVAAAVDVDVAAVLAVDAVVALAADQHVVAGIADQALAGHRALARGERGKLRGDLPDQRILDVRHQRRHEVGVVFREWSNATATMPSSPKALSGGSRFERKSRWVSGQELSRPPYPYCRESAMLLHLQLALPEDQGGCKRNTGSGKPRQRCPRCDRRGIVCFERSARGTKSSIPKMNFREFGLYGRAESRPARIGAGFLPSLCFAIRIAEEFLHECEVSCIHILPATVRINTVDPGPSQHGLPRTPPAAHRETSPTRYRLGLSNRREEVSVSG